MNNYIELILKGIQNRLEQIGNDLSKQRFESEYEDLIEQQRLYSSMV